MTLPDRIQQLLDTNAPTAYYVSKDKAIELHEGRSTGWLRGIPVGTVNKWGTSPELDSDLVLRVTALALLEEEVEVWADEQQKVFVVHTRIGQRPGFHRLYCNIFGQVSHGALFADGFPFGWLDLEQNQLFFRHWRGDTKEDRIELHKLSIQEIDLGVA